MVKCDGYVPYTKQEVRTLTDWVPSLKTDSNFQITSDCTPAYNCIGWALGMNDVWVRHGTSITVVEIFLRILNMDVYMLI